MTKLIIHRKGGAGSGNFGHSGRPGKVGGSSEGGGGGGGDDDFQTRRNAMHADAKSIIANFGNTKPKFDVGFDVYHMPSKKPMSKLKAIAESMGAVYKRGWKDYSGYVDEYDLNGRTILLTEGPGARNYVDVHVSG